MTVPGGSYTPPQRKTLEILHSFGPLRPRELALHIPTNQPGLSKIANHLYPLIAWADEPGVFFIPQEQQRSVYELVCGWQA